MLQRIQVHLLLVLWARVLTAQQVTLMERALIMEVLRIMRDTMWEYTVARRFAARVVAVAEAGAEVHEVAGAERPAPAVTAAAAAVAPSVQSLRKLRSTRKSRMLFHHLPQTQSE